MPQEQLCSDHRTGRTPRYKGKAPPRVNCPPCWEIWNAIQGEVAEAPEVQELRAELALYDREWSEIPRWLSPEKPKDHHAHLLSFLSDAHFGEFVDQREMGGYNAYSLDIADIRTRRFFERTVAIAQTYLAGVKYDGIILALGGDIVSGDIHAELTETNECTTYEAVEWAIPRLKAGIELWLEVFGQVHVVSAPGNHGRRTQKPKHKGRSADNADTHIARLLAGIFEGVPGATFNVPRSMDVDFSAYGTRFTMEHGDAFRGGDGQVGALGPVKRGQLRKTLQYTMEARPFDVMLLGHFHQLVMAPSQGFVMNGSLKGYDEYARANHFKPEPAQQALLVVTPEKGVTVQTPVFVADRSKEGW